MNENTTFNLVAMLTKDWAIAYDGKAPWESKEYQSYFDELTKEGVVIMGRKTFEGMPLDRRPWQGRLNVVLSREYPRYAPLNRDELVFTNLTSLECDIIPAHRGKVFWVIGGAEVYAALGNRCKNMYITALEKAAGKSSTGVVPFIEMMPDYELVKYGQRKWAEEAQCHYRMLQYKRNFKSPNMLHERQYLRLLDNILATGNARDDRTGVGTIGMFGHTMRYDVSKHLPILTTKFVPIGIITKELLWFMQGKTDAKVLQAQGVHIWDGNTSRDFLDKRGLSHYEEGDAGPLYGFQWRHFGATYEGCSADHTGKGFDQLEYVVNELKTNPFSRRIFMSAWNPPFLEQMALPPCHVSAQFYVQEDADSVRHLSLQFYQRSQDVFLAANFNLVSYTILLYIIAKKVGMYPKEVIHVMGDAHIYANHVEQCKEQVRRNPRPQPILELSPEVETKSWDEITMEDFSLIGYFPQPAIKAEMAV